MTKQSNQNYLDTINHPQFRVASLLVWQARKALEAMGMDNEQAYSWIKTWASGAGDGGE